MRPNRKCVRPILVIDDDAGIRQSLSDSLTDEGYEVVMAENGQEGLAWLRDHPSPGVILLDLWMPVMSGPQFRAEQLADPRLASIPVVLFSAVSDAGEAARRLGVQGWLKKPIPLDDLLDTVHGYCDLAGGPVPDPAPH